ncbi:MULTISPECIES: hypothetical protein [Paenibacillus]|jgi:hypothetical protein|uniref:hypothetical protein n=1 Tax=Paenibacillus TaxID=44249 RepID=UPI0004F5D14C|nr:MULTISPECIES: hypothetical protein [unclassified Paenibacillus]AIQ27706.1 hypothetical protein P40081_05510 [Paenibacillus sp. FSL P4-0081]OMF22968.1 hypothetical protein BK132_28080 [Paenibacillus sp. FSL H8-0259]
MKYNNLPATTLVRREMLPFVQQFPIIAAILIEMLYFVQDFQQAFGFPPQTRVEIVRFLPQQPYYSNFTAVKTKLYIHI